MSEVLTNGGGNVLTNRPERWGGGGGGGSDPANRADTITVANQAARLALTSDDVQPGDLVLQTDTDPATVWVLVAEDPSQAGNWVRWVSGTFVELEGNGNPHISRWGTYGFVQGSQMGGMEIGWGYPDIGSSLSRIAFGLGVSGTTAALTGLLAVGLSEAAAPLHARSSTGPQQIWEYAEDVYARITVDEDGNLKITHSGNRLALGAGASYTAAHATAIGDQATADYRAVALGASASAPAIYGIAIGYGATSSADHGMAFGYGSSAGYGEIALGSVAHEKFGVFGVTPCARPAAYTQTYSTAARTVTALLVDSSGGTSGGTVAAIADAPTANAVASILAQITDMKKVLNAIIDDHQGYGWFQ